MFIFNFPEKSLGLVSPTHFVYDFSRKMFLMLYSINSICDCNCLLTRLWRHKIWDSPYLSNQVVWLHDQEVKTKIYLENEKSFWGEIKCIFQHFERAFNCKKLSQAWKCTFKPMFYIYNPWKHQKTRGFQGV